MTDKNKPAPVTQERSRQSAFGDGGAVPLHSAASGKNCEAFSREGETARPHSAASGKNRLHIVLVEPEIPSNTGNIARSCAATGTILHLVKPLGFDIGDRAVKRAGLDYWPYVRLHVHENQDAFFDAYPAHPKYFVSTKGTRLYTDFVYEPGAMFVFGAETKGLPQNLIAENASRVMRIPMRPEERLRSLNLSNCANIVLYEALRQLGFPELR